MWQAETVVGIGNAAAKVRQYQARYGDRWSLAPLLARLAETGGKWSEAGAPRGTARA
jgi:hypothetical protein